MSRYRINYKLHHSNGTLVDESSIDHPLVFEIGDGQLDPCLERCVLDAKIGRLETFLLVGDDGFGDLVDEAYQTMMRNDFPADMEIKMDFAVEFKTPLGDSYIGCIDQIDGDEIRVNFNHPLAGASVSFQVEILDIS